MYSTTINELFDTNDDNILFITDAFMREELSQRLGLSEARVQVSGFALFLSHLVKMNIEHTNQIPSNFNPLPWWS